MLMVHKYSNHWATVPQPQESWETTAWVTLLTIANNFLKRKKKLQTGISNPIPKHQLRWDGLISLWVCTDMLKSKHRQQSFTKLGLCGNWVLLSAYHDLFVWVSYPLTTSLKVKSWPQFFEENIKLNLFVFLFTKVTSSGKGCLYSHITDAFAWFLSWYLEISINFT